MRTLARIPLAAGLWPRRLHPSPHEAATEHRTVTNPVKETEDGVVQLASDPAQNAGWRLSWDVGRPPWTGDRTDGRQTVESPVLQRWSGRVQRGTATSWRRASCAVPSGPTGRTSCPCCPKTLCRAPADSDGPSHSGSCPPLSPQSLCEWQSLVELCDEGDVDLVRVRRVPNVCNLSRGVAFAVPYGVVGKHPQSKQGLHDAATTSPGHMTKGVGDSIGHRHVHG